MEDNKNLQQPEEFVKKTEEEEKKTSPGDEQGGNQGSEQKPNEEKKPENGSNNGGSEDEKKKKYDLSEVVEYTALKAEYEELKQKYEALESAKAALDAKVEGLEQFKLTAERASKQTMIDSFYMLSDEDKQDVVNNIDAYSLDDIEAKLSIMCVRNKVNFNLDESDTKNGPQGLFNLQGAASTDNAPEWLKAIRATANQQ